jgi:hypothetical protein
MLHTNETMRAEIDRANALKVKSIEALDAELQLAKQRVSVIEDARVRVARASLHEIIAQDASEQADAKRGVDLAQHKREKQMYETRETKRKGAERVLHAVWAGSLPIFALAEFIPAPTPGHAALACAAYYSILGFLAAYAF